MTRVVIATVRLLEFMEGGGHFWAYMQYVEALRQLDCEVFVLDSSIWSDAAPDPSRVHEFHDRMARYGLQDRVLVAANGNSAAAVPDVLHEADLLLNFNYHLDPQAVAAVRRTALVDIDPGLLQFWISRRFISPAAHDIYFTTGETVGQRPSPIPDCGLPWVQIRPPVALALWPYTHDPVAETFTTVASWWGERDYVGDPQDYYDNTKRAAFFARTGLDQRRLRPPMPSRPPACRGVLRCGNRRGTRCWSGPLSPDPARALRRARQRRQRRRAATAARARRSA